MQARPHRGVRAQGVPAAAGGGAVPERLKDGTEEKKQLNISRKKIQKSLLILLYLGP